MKSNWTLNAESGDGDQDAWNPSSNFVVDILWAESFWMRVGSYESISLVYGIKKNLNDKECLSLIIHVPHFIPFPGFRLYGSFLIKDDIPIPGPAWWADN